MEVLSRSAHLIDNVVPDVRLVKEAFTAFHANAKSDFSHPKSGYPQVGQMSATGDSFDVLGPMGSIRLKGAPRLVSDSMVVMLVSCTMQDPFQPEKVHLVNSFQIHRTRLTDVYHTSQEGRQQLTIDDAWIIIGGLLHAAMAIAPASF